MASRLNRFSLEGDDENRFLRVDSADSASALWRALDLDVRRQPLVSWRRKVDKSVGHIENERRRGSDDYAARLAVMFDGEPFDESTAVLMYVWAGKELVGNAYPSPYAATVATIVLRSGDLESGRWIREERDVAVDFERLFGRAPKRVTGIAVMVDTDNTGSKATAWFDDLTVACRVR